MADKTLGHASNAISDGAGSDLAEVSARFGAALREAGLPVGPARCERFAAAVTVARPVTPRALYQCALATLVSSKDHALIMRAVFEQVFGGLAGDAAAAPAGRGGLGELPTASPEHLLASAATAARQHAGRLIESLTADSDGEGPADDDGAPEAENRYLGTSQERLASKDFAELSDDELITVAILMRRLTLAVPERQSRRQRRRPGGRRTDMRATLRQARRTGGDAFRLIGRTPARRPRRLVVLCDISGSMEPYARAYLQFLACAARPGSGAEAFVFATRLTRITRALAARNPERALERAAAAAPDWSSGTRIGDALRAFNDRHGRRGMARGAVVVILSDGWERGDPAVVDREMARLRRLAHRIVWVNPRLAARAYSVQSGGMQAALPHCDAFVSGHSFEALEEVVAAIGAESWDAPEARLDEADDEPWPSATPVAGSSVAMPSGYGPSRGRTTPGWGAE
jgi:uncharacterized protein